MHRVHEKWILDRGLLALHKVGLNSWILLCLIAWLEQELLLLHFHLLLFILLELFFAVDFMQILVLLINHFVAKSALNLLKGRIFARNHVRLHFLSKFLSFFLFTNYCEGIESKSNYHK